MSFVRLLTWISGLAFLFYGITCVSSLSMVKDFERFGMPWLRVPTGALEVLGGAGLLIGLKWQPALWISSAGLALMMFVAFGVRLWMRDSVSASLPSLTLALVNSYIFYKSLRG